MWMARTRWGVTCWSSVGPSGEKPETNIKVYRKFGALEGYSGGTFSA
jgi:hypothetical protein